MMFLCFQRLVESLKLPTQINTRSKFIYCQHCCLERCHPHLIKPETFTLTQRASSLQPLTDRPWTAVCQLLLSSHSTQLHPCTRPVDLTPRTPRPSCEPSPALWLPRSSIITDRQAPHFTTQRVTSSQQHMGSPQSLRHLCALLSPLPAMDTLPISPKRYLFFPFTFSAMLVFALHSQGTSSLIFQVKYLQDILKFQNQLLS